MVRMWIVMVRTLVLTGVSLRVSLAPSVVMVVLLSVIEGTIMIVMMIALPPLCQGPGIHLQPSVLHPKLRGGVVGAMSIDDSSAQEESCKEACRQYFCVQKEKGGGRLLNDEDDDDVDSDDGKPPRKISTRKPTLCPTRKWVITVRQMTKMRMTLIVMMKKMTRRVIISLKLMRPLTENHRRRLLGILLKSLPIINKPIYGESLPTWKGTFIHQKPENKCCHSNM
jgi:hypothetical protein